MTSKQPTEQRYRELFAKVMEKHRPVFEALAASEAEDRAKLETPEQTREWSILEHFHACGLAAQNQREKRSAPEFWDTSPI